MIREGIAKVVEGQDLTESKMMEVMEIIMAGEATPAQIGAFITALRMKGETVAEITGAVRVMRRKATRIDARASVIVDTCGTGGDRAGTFNISTTAAFVVAAAGITVAKHGNRAVSSGCGSADLLEALGVNISAGPEIVEEAIAEEGIGFLFAPLLHGAMKHAIGPRREIGIRTIFNMLGPLTNPAGATNQLIGVYDGKLTETFAFVLRELGTRRAFVVHGLDGLDEATVTCETRVTELKNGLITTFNLDPVTYFGKTYPLKELAGGNAQKNAEITRSILSGQEKGARKDIVLLNAALAIVAAGRAEKIEEGIAVARACVDNGEALRKLNRLIEITNR
ncbi:MAG TPA: anthranilate phosphoribosyltransferase [Syntrophales bacterium]|nr:anthranilate phosphoribosyltransferase [Syntrophales bacterium]HOL58833.1 anthranilate phosphoribosyltransferase [Syntrophales bacterium]HPO35160.1 anthranilate phosphoribosyltransferase [Syntrophales bacterium]